MSETFHSILYERPEDREDVRDAPPYFADLYLDQIVDAVTAGREQYDLKPFFYRPLSRREAVEYRQEIMRDLEDGARRSPLDTFAQNMRRMGAQLAQTQKLYHQYQKELWFLTAVEIYCEAVVALARELSAIVLGSRGLKSWCEYLRTYVNSPRFESLHSQTRGLRDDLSAIRYCVLIKGGEVRVRKYPSQDDYSAEIEATFAKFKQGAVEDYRVKFKDYPGLDPIEAKVLDCVAELHPDVFRLLDDYCAAHRDYPDDRVAAFDREIQFYLAYLDYIAGTRQAGLPFCYPQVSATDKQVSCRAGFDLALATKLVAENKPVVCNDFYLEGKERVLVVSGPNQGGKTTFARSFGQLHYLASLGCPVPGEEARVLLCDRLLTHFEREERAENLRGELQDDLLRIRTLLEQATPRSVILMNEIFTSTTFQDAAFLSKHIMEKLLALDVVCVWVTFLDELASFSEQTVSMVGSVLPENPAVRTFRITRRPADGLAYALALAEKYRLTCAQIRERLAT
jgi:hypothetical protein